MNEPRDPSQDDDKSTAEGELSAPDDRAADARTPVQRAAKALADALQLNADAQHVSPLHGIHRALSAAVSHLMGDSSDRPRRLEPGTEIPPYRITRLVGSGGMADVYEAERADGEFRQRVAIKIAHQSSHPERTARRDERLRVERQTLCDFVHPYVVRLLDGGSVRGIPYFVTELVDGMHIDEHCREERLALRARIQLFQLVADAVASAHSRPLVHCDLKPSNILVNQKGDPRLCDFGMAKILGLADDDAGTGGWTLEYAAPEQLGGSPITTQADVYALGVVLFQLITGELPITLSCVQEEGEGDVLAQAKRSATIPQIAALLETKRSRRGPSRVWRASACLCDLRPGLVRDLEAILQKALAPSPEGRYETAHEFRDDLRRLLEERPIKAREEDPWHQVEKTIRRHPRVSMMAVLAGMLLWSAALALVVQQRRTLHQARRAESVVDALSGVLQLSDPDVRGGQDITATQLIQGGLAEAESNLAGDPATLAAVLDVAGVSFLRLGSRQEAERLHRRALELIRSTDPIDGVKEGVTRGHLGIDLLALGRDEDAKPHLDESLEVLRHEPRNTRQVGELLDALGNYHRAVDEPAAARKRYYQAIVWRANFGEDETDVARTLGNLALLEKRLGNYSWATTLLERALAIDRDAYGENHTRIARNLTNLAAVQLDQGRSQEAIPYYRRALAVKEALYGDDSVDVAQTLGELGMTLSEERHLEEAERLLQRALEIKQRALPDPHPSIAFAHEFLGLHYWTAKDHAAAEKRFRLALQIFQETRGLDHIDTLRVQGNIAALYEESGRAEVALRILEDTIPKLRSINAPQDNIIQFLLTEASATRKTNKSLDCASLYQNVISLSDQALADEPDNLGMIQAKGHSLLGEAECVSRNGEHERARVLRLQAMAQATLILHEAPGDPDGLEIRQKAAEQLQPR